MKKKVSKENFILPSTRRDPYLFLSLPSFSTASILSNFCLTVKNFLCPTKAQYKVLFAYFFFQEKVGGDPYGNRTHVCGVRGRRLNRLTNGPCHASRPSQRHTAHHSAKNTFALRANCFFVCVVRCAPAPRRSALHYGAPSGIRTRDPLIKSQLLYQLS